MIPSALLPAVALIAGSCVGTFSDVAAPAITWPLPILAVAAAACWTVRWPATTLAILAAGYCTAGAALSAHARAEALRPALRSLLEQQIGGFAIESLGPANDHEPIAVHARLTEDAALAEGFVALRATVTHVEAASGAIAAAGGVLVSIGGAAAAARAHEWRGGRTVRMPATLRRPARYLNAGVPDFEQALALDGTSLFASVKSGLLVEVEAHGSALAEAAASIRAHVRDAVARRIAPHGTLSAGIVNAVLIGDRSGLPDAVRDLLQRAGTYHVIAISGGNIAILALVTLGLLACSGLRGRPAAALTIAVLLLYASVATAGPSVLRATLMAVLHLAARVVDHRTPPWQTALIAAALMVVLEPLDVRDPGFILTFGATAALLEGAQRARRLVLLRPPASWLLGSLAASLAAEVVLLPAAAHLFSRLTAAGLVLNLLAVPLMGIVQIAGMIVVALDAFDGAAALSGFAAHHAAAGLVGSARLVDLAPWLTRRVPQPGLGLLLLYYGALLVLLRARPRRVRALGGAALLVAGLMIATGVNAGSFLPRIEAPRVLALNVFDVGQGEAMLLTEPDGATLLTDTGGSPFGGGTFDIGERVLAPALWARGVTTIDGLLLTHFDPDHAGGARSVIEDFGPRALWEGIRVPHHAPTRDVMERAARRHTPIRMRRAGESFRMGGVRVRVLNPPEPSWERQRVRNDDSVVLEILHGRVALLLTGDITAEVERLLLPQLTDAPVRVLKVAHHGSRTSTSAALLEHWQPQLAIISAGRGNTFGHPAPDVLRRLEAVGATVLRTDRDGEITVVSDGESVRWRTYTGRGGTTGGSSR